MTKEIRTRIAPSPTGMMHLGTARTAIYCWAYARHFIGGKFLLRIEDTDQERSTQEAVDVILDGMKWLELDYDEGPIFQMDRLDRYKEVVDDMLAKGLAYKCYATKEELDALREEQMANKQKPRYDGRWRPENAVGREIPEGVTPVIRFRNPDTGTVTWKDQVYGEISFENTELDDLVIMRGDGIPTYNFAVVVDDLDMKVSHVVRGADHINNTPRQINLYRALGAEVPEFAHLPLINGPDNKKLSKRNGDASVMDYELKGYLPEAVVNYLARLGWGHGNDEKFDKATVKAALEKFVAVYDYNDDSAVWFDKVKAITEELGFTTDMKAYKADPAAFPGTVADISTFIRQAVTGKTNAPDLHTVMQILGKDRSLARINAVISKL